LAPVTVSQQEELHVGDLVGPDQARPLQVAQVTQIDINRPVLVAGTSAIALKTGQRPLDGILGAAQSPAGCAKKSGLGQRGRRP